MDRNVHHAQNGKIVLDESDVDGKLAVSLHELLGAVERIDHPEVTPFCPLAVGYVPTLLTEDWHGIRKEGGADKGCESRKNNVVGPTVGHRQRRSVLFKINFELCPVNFKYSTTRFADDLPERRDQ